MKNKLETMFGYDDTSMMNKIAVAVLAVAHAAADDDDDDDDVDDFKTIRKDRSLDNLE